MHLPEKVPKGGFLEDVLRMSHGRRLDNVLRKVVTTSILGQSKMSLRRKLRRIYDVFVTSLYRLGFYLIYVYLLSL